jgi:hypothetical protein
MAMQTSMDKNKGQLLAAESVLTEAVLAARREELCRSLPLIPFASVRTIATLKP